MNDDFDKIVLQLQLKGYVVKIVTYSISGKYAICILKDGKFIPLYPFDSGGSRPKIIYFVDLTLENLKDHFVRHMKEYINKF